MKCSLCNFPITVLDKFYKKEEDILCISCFEKIICARCGKHRITYPYEGFYFCMECLNKAYEELKWKKKL